MAKQGKLLTCYTWTEKPRPSLESHINQKQQRCNKIDPERVKVWIFLWRSFKILLGLFGLTRAWIRMQHNIPGAIICSHKYRLSRGQDEAIDQPTNYNGKMLYNNSIFSLILNDKTRKVWQVVRRESKFLKRNNTPLLKHLPALQVSRSGCLKKI